VTADIRTLREIATDLKSKGLACNCDLDTWEPEPESGHSHVCRIHKKAWTMKHQPWDIKGLPHD